MTANTALATAQRWAKALDDDDFDRLPRFLSSDCLYRTPGGDLIGPKAIVASYRSSSEWAHETFESIVWESECDLEGDDRVRITFIDITDHKGVHHVYRCQQVVHVDDAGLIDEITHVALEQEELALAVFFDRVAVSRPG